MFPESLLLLYYSLYKEHPQRSIIRQVLPVLGLNQPLLKFSKAAFFYDFLIIDPACNANIARKNSITRKKNKIISYFFILSIVKVNAPLCSRAFSCSQVPGEKPGNIGFYFVFFQRDVIVLWGVE